MHNKKGQQAVEWLQTYGWALLSAFIVIVLLTYYYFSSDVLTPQQQIQPEECMAQSYCKEVGLDFKRYDSYRYEIVCYKEVIENLTSIDYIFNVEDIDRLLERYPDCMSSDNE